MISSRAVNCIPDWLHLFGSCSFAAVLFVRSNKGINILSFYRLFVVQIGLIYYSICSNITSLLDPTYARTPNSFYARYGELCLYRDLMSTLGKTPTVENFKKNRQLMMFIDEEDLYNGLTLEEEDNFWKEVYNSSLFKRD